MHLIAKRTSVEGAADRAAITLLDTPSNGCGARFSTRAGVDWDNERSAKVTPVDARHRAMITQSNYDQIAANLDYAKVAKMLEELTKLPPPKTQVTVADVLAPIIGNLRNLHAKGWTYDQLSKELKDAGLPINTSALRRHLRTRGKRRNKCAARSSSS